MDVEKPRQTRMVLLYFCLVFVFLAFMEYIALIVCTVCVISCCQYGAKKDDDDYTDYYTT